MNIIEFKNRKVKFKEWLKEVQETNFNDQEVDHCVIIWENTKEVNYARFNCDLHTLRYLHQILGCSIRKLELDEFLKENIGDYIQYIED